MMATRQKGELAFAGGASLDSVVGLPVRTVCHPGGGKHVICDVLVKERVSTFSLFSKNVFPN